MASRTLPSKVPRPPPPIGYTPMTANSAKGGKDSPLAPAESMRRIRSVDDLLSIYSRFVQDNTLRSSTFAQTRNQLEGGLPFDPKLLEAQGAAWQTNVNFGDSQAARDRTLLPYWKMINDAPTKIVVKIQDKSPSTPMWEAAFAEAFDDYLDDWGADYQVQYMNFASNVVNFGPGIVQWRDPDDPCYSAVNVQRIYFPKNARMSPDSWDVLCLVADISPSELYLKVKDAKAKKVSTAAGWNVKAVEAAISATMYGNSNRDPRDYTRWQDDLVQNDITVQSIFEPAQLIWGYVRQFNGDIGCYVCLRNGGVNEFLFEDEKYAESFRHLLGCVWYDTGVDSLIHSIKGFAIKNYGFATVQNRLKSRMVDSGTIAFGVNLQRTEGGIPDEAPPVENYGPYTIFPDKLQQMQFYPQLQAGIAILGTLEQNQSENNSLYRQQGANQIAESDTATQANILATMQGDLNEASASLYLAQFGENINAEQVRRLRKRGNKNEHAKTFVRRLRDLGVPDKIIFDAKIRVKTGANAGMASAAVRLQKAQMALSMIGQPGMNDRFLRENYVSQVLGGEGVQKAMLPEGVPSAPAQRRQALMENADFGQAIPLPVDPADAHVEHAEEHLRPISSMVAAFKQNGQISPEQVPALAIGLEHTGMHMQYIKADRTKKQAFQALWPIFSEAQSVVRGILTRLQKQGPAALQNMQNGGQPMLAAPPGG